MNQVQCPRFHLYHLVDSVDGGCPVCATQETDLSKTRSLFGPAGADHPDHPDHDPDDTLAPTPRVDGNKTVGAYAHLGAGVEPVVGWLACVGGPDRGRDWRLVSGRNHLGRGDGVGVQLMADPGVSRGRHAVISFDPRRSSFTLAPGDGAGMVYCNGREVVLPLTLAAHDRIELGSSALVFVPLVGARFSWAES
ncbi:MAG: FHA domain-containing protein [Rubrivivax sp.]|nr:FHA domain-containing protein [Rubrivivax sp.]MBK8525765.1 FHA domain-containing protein [Rubrivivax sp.]